MRGAEGSSMQVNTLVVFLHVLLAFAAIALLIVPGIMLEMVARTHDAGLIRRVYPLGKFHGQVGGPLSLLAALLGFVVAWRLGIPLNSGWLIATYVAFVLAVGLGIFYHSRRELRIGALAAASASDTPSPELAALIDDRAAMPVNWISLLLWTFIIWLMVAKPF